MPYEKVDGVWLWYVVENGIRSVHTCVSCGKPLEYKELAPGRFAKSHKCSDAHEGHRKGADTRGEGCSVEERKIPWGQRLSQGFEMLGMDDS